jgi:hypothetical protein
MESRRCLASEGDLLGDGATESFDRRVIDGREAAGQVVVSSEASPIYGELTTKLIHRSRLIFQGGKMEVYLASSMEKEFC